MVNSVKNDPLEQELYNTSSFRSLAEGRIFVAYWFGKWYSRFYERGGFMNILSIGNSFSQDAQRYLHRIARADKVELNTFNLYIGGCPLSLHYQNILSEERRYTLEMNGSSTGFYVSLKEALLNRDWDIVTIQQVSAQSPYYDTYQPYLDKLAEYIRLFVPKAKIVVHQTWAYEQGSRRLHEELKYSDYKQMLCDI